MKEAPEDTPQEILYPDITRELEAMVRVDQDMRGKVVRGEEGFRPEVDEKNTARMKEIVNEIGWPTISKVGEKGSNNAWLLVQHADYDVEFQRKCLELMKAEVVGEVSLPNIAYLEDRVLLNEGKPQIYGTQFTKEGEKFVPRNLANPEKVNERRQSMNLDTLEENLQRMMDAYKK